MGRVEQVEGEVVGLAVEVHGEGLGEKGVGGGDLSEEGQAGAKFEVVGGAEALANEDGGLVGGGEQELRAFEESGTEDGVGEVGGGFVE